MTICIDAGHYGKYNCSPANPNYYEAEAMWRLHLMLCEELKKRGIKTITTRSDQAEDMPLVQRGEKARGCDLFLSLHSNAVGEDVREDIDYPVAYVSISGSADEIGLKLAQCVQGVMQTVQKARIEHKTGSSGKDYYGVLRGAQTEGVPGVILEHSFHTNTNMTDWLLSDSNLKTLAIAEAQVIAEHFGISDKPDRYVHLYEIPNEYGFRDIIEDMMNKGIIAGDGSDIDGNADVIDLSHDMVRMLVFLHRAGIFDKA